MIYGCDAGAAEIRRFALKLLAVRDSPGVWLILALIKKCGMHNPKNISIILAFRLIYSHIPFEYYPIFILSINFAVVQDQVLITRWWWWLMSGRPDADNSVVNDVCDAWDLRCFLIILARATVVCHLCTNQWLSMLTESRNCPGSGMALIVVAVFWNYVFLHHPYRLRWAFTENTNYEKWNMKFII